MYSLDNKFVPSFKHFLSLAIGAVGAALGGLWVEGWTRFILFVFAVGLMLASIKWLFMLDAESKARHYIASQETEQYSLQLVLKANAEFGYLPPAARLQALHKLFPDLDLASVHIPPEVAPQIHTAPNESFEHRVNISKAEMAKLRAAAVEFNGKFSRNKLSPKYFSQDDYKRIYDELIKESPNHVSYATPDGLNDSPILTDAGWKWLGLSPGTALLDGFTPL